MRIEDILRSSVAIDRVQKQKHADVKNASLSLSRVPDDEIGFLRQTDENLMAIRDRQQSFMRHETIVSGLEILRQRVGDFSRLPAERRNYEAFSQDLQQTVHQTRFQGETPLAYLSLRINDERGLYTLGQQIDQEMMVHQARLRQERKHLASFLVTMENRDAMQGISSGDLMNDLRQTLGQTSEYPAQRNHSFAQIMKIL